MSKAAAGVVGFDEALEMVLTRAADLAMPAIEQISLLASEDRVLAMPVHADRDQSPFDRSTRDGYVVRSKEAASGAQLRCAGEIKAGDMVMQSLAAGCVFPDACVAVSGARAA